MLYSIRKLLTMGLLTFCGLFFTTLVNAQENTVTGAYEYTAQNEAYIQFYLSPNHRFALALQYGATILEIRGKYTIKGDSVYMEQDKTAQTFFDIYAAYNPAIPNGKRIIYNYLPKIANTLFSINKTYNITTLTTPGLDLEDGGDWNKKDISLDKGNKLWLYTTNNLHQVEEYIIPETFNEINIVPDLSQTGHFKLPRKIKAVLNTQKNLITDLGLGTGGLLFKHIADPLSQEDRQGLEKPLPNPHLHTQNLNYTTIKVNRQFEDKNTDTLTIIDEEQPNLGNQSVTPAPQKSGEPQKYDGAYAGNDGMTTTKIWFRRERLNFVSMIIKKNPAKEEPEEMGVDGTFKLKNDTAFLTTSPAYDEIRLYGRANEKIKAGQLKITFPAADKLKIQIKSGSNYTSSAPFSRSADFIKVNDSTLSYTLNKTDSLWIAYSEKETHIYNYTFDNPLTSRYNELIITAGRYKAFNKVDYPVYQNKEGQLFLNRNKKPSLQILPANKQTDMADFASSPTDFFKPDNGPIFDELDRKAVFLDPLSKK